MKRLYLVLIITILSLSSCSKYNNVGIIPPDGTYIAKNKNLLHTIFIS